MAGSPQPASANPARFRRGSVQGVVAAGAGVVSGVAIGAGAGAAVVADVGVVAGAGAGVTVRAGVGAALGVGVGGLDTGGVAAVDSNL